MRHGAVPRHVVGLGRLACITCGVWGTGSLDQRLARGVEPLESHPGGTEVWTRKDEKVDARGQVNGGGEQVQRTSLRVAPLTHVCRTRRPLFSVHPLFVLVSKSHVFAGGIAHETLVRGEWHEGPA